MPPEWERKLAKFRAQGDEVQTETRSLVSKTQALMWKSLESACRARCSEGCSKQHRDIGGRGGGRLAKNRLRRALRTNSRRGDGCRSSRCSRCEKRTAMGLSVRRNVSRPNPRQHGARRPMVVRRKP